MYASTSSFAADGVLVLLPPWGICGPGFEALLAEKFDLCKSQDAKVYYNGICVPFSRHLHLIVHRRLGQVLSLCHCRGQLWRAEICEESRGL